MAQRLKTDWTLFLTIVLTVCFGLVIVYSASSVVAEMKFRSSSHFLVRQIFWAVFGFAALMYFKTRNYHKFQSGAWAFAPIGIVVLLLVVAYIVDMKAHRWIRIGSFSLQPSEFAKPALALFLAYFVSLRTAAINSRYTIRQAAVMVIVVALMVGVPDLGTAIVLVVTSAAVFYAAGLDKRYFLAAAAAGLLLITAAIIAKPTRVIRIIGFVDPDYKLLDKIDPGGRVKSYLNRAQAASDPGYQVRQSKIAVGSGGVVGAGLMQSRQKLFYLPEAHTDFIYAVVGEELGLWGATAVLMGFLVILWRGLRLFWTAQDDFGRYLALAITISILCQAFINMSVVLGIVPNKGIPLPMISAGGSSLLSTLASMGLLLSVSENAG